MKPESFAEYNEHIIHATIFTLIHHLSIFSQLEENSQNFLVSAYHQKSIYTTEYYKRLERQSTVIPQPPRHKLFEQKPLDPQPHTATIFLRQLQMRQ